MNKIGIIFAIKEELEAALSNFELVNEYKIFDLTYIYLLYSPLFS